ncbi:MAG: hypothetical protein VYD57_08305 [Pseudomonadota bacterium]|nr:hypothetical protein [Pseudomonadota bacterium]
MSWNYRIIRHAEGHFSLHEVYYDQDGQPESYTADPISFVVDEEEGPKGIVESLRLALQDAQTRPVLDIVEFQSSRDTPK